MWNNKNIFEPSGCISRKAMEALINGDLPDDLRAIAENHIATCQFCSDAKEGFEYAAKKQNITKLLLKADQRFEKQIGNKINEPNNKRILWTSIPAAAAILIFILLYNIKDTNLSDQKVAENLPHQADTNTFKKDSNIKSTEKLSEENAIKRKEELSKPALRKESPASSEISDIETKPLQEPVMADDKEEIPLSLQVTDSRFVQDTVISPPQKSENIKEEEYAYVPTSTAGASSRARMNSGSAPKLKKAEGSHAFFSLSAESPPRFKNGSINDFQKYIQREIGFFNDSTKAVKVVVRFTVDTSGNITDAKIVQGSNAKNDSTIIRKIRNSKGWSHAYEDGNPVKAELQITVFVE